MKTIAVIPARYGSSRFPGKPLALINGKPMIQVTYESTLKCADISDVYVATDDQRIFDAVVAFGGKAVMTSPDHTCGTDRIAEAIANLDGDLIINVQGDEPMISPIVLSELIAKMQVTSADMGTAAVPFKYTTKSPEDPNAVKVVMDNNGLALYFSRSMIPYLRPDGGKPTDYFLHWGLYAYTREFLQKFVTWAPGRLECSEKLEQLRALENGAKICVITTTESSVGVDVPEDIARVEEMLKSK